MIFCGLAMVIHGTRASIIKAKMHTSRQTIRVANAASRMSSHGIGNLILRRTQSLVAVEALMGRDTERVRPILSFHSLAA